MVLSVTGIIIYKCNRGAIYKLESQDPCKVFCFNIKFIHLTYLNRLCFLNSQASGNIFFTPYWYSALGLAILGIVNLNISFWTHATFALLFFICNYNLVVLLTLLYCLMFRWENRKNSFLTRLRASKDSVWLQIKITCAIMCSLSLPCNGPVVWLIVSMILL